MLIIGHAIAIGVSELQYRHIYIYLYEEQQNMLYPLTSDIGMFI